MYFNIMINIIDFVIFLFLFWQGWRGFNNGLIVELGGLLIWFISFILSMNDQNIINQIIGEILKLFKLTNDLNWVFSFIFIYIILFVLLRLITNAIDSLSLGFINNFLGAFFGVVKWWLIINIFVFIIVFCDKKGLANIHLSYSTKTIISNSYIVKVMHISINHYLEHLNHDTSLKASRPGSLSFSKNSNIAPPPVDK